MRSSLGRKEEEGSLFEKQLRMEMEGEGSPCEKQPGRESM